MTGELVVDDVVELVALELELGVEHGAFELDELRRLQRGRALLAYQRELALEQRGPRGE